VRQNTKIKCEEGYEVLKFGVMLQEMRKQKNMTQKQLAGKEADEL